MHRPSASTVSRIISDATATVDVDSVTISVRQPTKTKVSNGTLSDALNAIAGPIADEIDVSDLEISLSGGEPTLERIESSSCFDNGLRYGFAGAVLLVRQGVNSRVLPGDRERTQRGNLQLDHKEMF